VISCQLSLVQYSGIARCSADLQIGVDRDDVRQDADLGIGATISPDPNCPKIEF